MGTAASGPTGGVLESGQKRACQLCFGAVYGRESRWETGTRTAGKVTQDAGREPPSEGHPRRARLVNTSGEERK